MLGKLKDPVDTPAEVGTYTLDLSGAAGHTDVAICTSGGLDTRGRCWAPLLASPRVTNDHSVLVGWSPEFYIVRWLEPASYQINVMGDGQAAGVYTCTLSKSRQGFRAGAASPEP